MSGFKTSWGKLVQIDPESETVELGIPQADWEKTGFVKEKKKTSERTEKRSQKNFFTLSVSVWSLGRLAKN